MPNRFSQQYLGGFRHICRYRGRTQPEGVSVIMGLAQVIDGLSIKLANAIRWLALAMVVVTLAIVVLRYAFEIGAIPLQESVMYMHGLLFLLGIPYGINKNSHVRVDILYSNLSPKRQAMIDLSGHVIFLLPIAIFILVTSWPYTLASWRVFEGSAEVGGVPGVFLLKTLIPITAVLMALQTFAEIIKQTAKIRA
ncbi:MAG: TRAP transporter small permease subunit [Pseudomonadales bacterium]|nr:TRAP transporter small permease subunit [Pseudomonadales bacterium]